MSTTARRRMRLGELLVAAGVLDETHLNAALAEQRKWGGKLGRVLVDMKLVSEDLMVKALSRQLGIPRVDLDKQQLEASVVQLLGVDVCERYGVFPVGVDEERHIIQLAASDPTNYEAIDEVSFRTGRRVEPVVATASSIERAIRRYYYGDTGASAETLDPRKLGLGSERMIEFDDDGTGRGVGEPRTGVDVTDPGAPRAAGDATAAIERIEKTLSAEVKALRSLVELLVETGVIRREDYLAKIRSK